ncbi:hypothetical protein KBI52_03580 [Microvirga sp. HBU67558]|uniref:hypothetical protein n=1 Tax=Microvirga TaxID=186650 RepID=UPI001B37B696|nr:MULTISPECIES: hypothetical protein [unclassified Microvirga]MBQ0819313.1 hypothetical protein [Microvirga sp. HBU67558]
MQEEFSDPSGAQPQAEIERYDRNVEPGEPAAIRETEGHSLRFILTAVEVVNPKQGRVYLKKAPSSGGTTFYMKSGKNYGSPTGQSRLVIPTSEVRAFAEEHPRGRMGWSKG